jgi:hypothetical protein
MPNPFEDWDTNEIHVVTPHDSVTGRAAGDQQLARALDVVRHANAFVLIGEDAAGNEIRMAFAQAISQQRMAALYASAASYATEELLRVLEEGER